MLSFEYSSPRMVVVQSKAINRCAGDKKSKTLTCNWQSTFTPILDASSSKKIHEFSLRFFIPGNTRGVMVGIIPGDSNP